MSDEIFDDLRTALPNGCRCVEDRADTDGRLTTVRRRYNCGLSATVATSAEGSAVRAVREYCDRQHLDLCTQHTTTPRLIGDTGIVRWEPT